MRARWPTRSRRRSRSWSTSRTRATSPDVDRGGTGPRAARARPGADARPRPAPGPRGAAGAMRPAPPVSRGRWRRMHVTGSRPTPTWTARSTRSPASAAALVSMPLRHMHSPAEVCALADLDDCSRADRPALPDARLRRTLGRAEALVRPRSARRSHSPPAAAATSRPAPARPLPASGDDRGRDRRRDDRCGHRHRDGCDHASARPASARGEPDDVPRRRRLRPRATR